jgi:hypothetical protein
MNNEVGEDCTLGGFSRALYGQKLVSEKLISKSPSGT